jgi:rare lipoprotein A
MKTLTQLLALLVATMALGGVAVAIAADPAPTPVPTPVAVESLPAPAAATGTAETGLAAVYSDKLHGRKTANGDRYDRSRLTAAHKSLPFGTRVKVTNVKNNKSVVVRINDRGPIQAGRILDLSPAAAQTLGIPHLGMGEVSAEVVGEAEKTVKR